MGLFDWILKKKQKDYLLEWHKKYMVGIREIDIQHEKLFGMYNNLVSAMYRGESIEVLGGVLDDLLKYVVVHFRTEEGYFDKYQYPEKTQHEAEHRQLMERTYNLHKDFGNGKPVLTEEVLIFLKRWVSEHILGMDHRYKPFLLKRVPQV